MKRVRRFIAMGMVLVMLTINCGLAAMAAEEIKLPKGLKVIDDEAFSGTPSIKKVVVPDKTEEIREKAFANSSVSEINMPKSIKVIDDTAFDMEFKYANTGEVIWPNSVYDGFDVRDGVVIGVSRMSYALYSESGKMKVLAFALDNKPDFTNDKEYEKRKGDYLINEDVSASQIKDAIRNHSVLINIPRDEMSGVKYIRMMLGFYFNKTDETPTKWVSYGFKMFMPSVAMDRTSAMMRKGDKLALNANYDRGRAKGLKVKWRSYNKKVAEVDQNGLVTAKSVGRASITAEITIDRDVIYRTECEITVVDAADLSKTVAGIVWIGGYWLMPKDSYVEFWTKGASKPTATARPNSDGLYALELKNGSYTVKAVVNGLTGYEGTATITDEARIYDISIEEKDMKRIEDFEVYINGVDARIPYAKLTLLDSNGNIIAQKTANEDGWFEEYFFVTEGSYTFKASATGYKPGSVRFTVTRDPKNPEDFVVQDITDIKLDPVLYTVSGRVTDSIGKPLSGANVRLSSRINSKEVKTDAQGNYKLELLYGSYKMRVSLEDEEGELDFTTYKSDIEVKADLKLSDIRLTPLVPRLTGKLVDAQGKSIADAYIELLDSSRNYVNHHYLDGNSAFGFSGREAGEYKLKIIADGYFDKEIAVTVKEGDNDLGNIVLISAYRMTGKLVNAQGDSIVDAYITLLDSSGNWIGAFYSDENGAFESLKTEAGKYKLRITADGYLDKEIAVTVKEEDKDFGNIVLKSYPRLTGKLVDAQGKSIADAHIELLDSSGVCIDTHNSEADGDFEWINMEAGEYKLRITADGYFDKEIAVTVKEEGKDFGNIVLNRYPRLTGKLVDAQGKSIADAGIELLDSSDNYVDNLFSDANGTFEFTDREAGEYKLRIIADGYLDKEMAVTVKEEDKDLGNIVLNSNKTTLTLSGRVVSANDDTVPVADASVMIYYKSSGGGEGCYTDTLTDSEGRFTFANLEMRLDYDYYFYVQGTNYETYDGSSVNEWFQPSAEITGKIIKLTPLG